MMAQDLDLVGRWVPRNANIITILLVAVATVNSAVSPSPLCSLL